MERGEGLEPYDVQHKHTSASTQHAIPSRGRAAYGGESNVSPLVTPFPSEPQAFAARMLTGLPKS